MVAAFFYAVIALGKHRGAVLKQHSAADGAFDILQLLQCHFVVGGVDIHHYVANLVVSLQILRGDIDVVVGENLVDLGEHAGNVGVHVQQAMCVRVTWQGNFGEVDRAGGGAVV